MNNIAIYLDKERKYGFDIDEDRAEEFLEAWDMFLVAANLLGYRYDFDFLHSSVRGNIFDFSVVFGNVDTFMSMTFNLIGYSLYSIRVCFDDDKYKTFKYNDLEKCFKECQESL